MKKIGFILLSTILISFFSAKTICAQETDSSQENSIATAIFESENIVPVENLEQLSKNTNISLTNYNSGILSINFMETPNTTVSLQVEILPSLSDYFKNKAVIGHKISISDGYELLSFRIEQSADTLTLMSPNYFLEGEQVLYLAIENLNSRDIYYLQTKFTDISFSQLISDSENNYLTSSLDSESLISLEDAYLTLRTNEKTVRLSNENINSTEGTVYIEDGNFSSPEQNSLTRSSTLIPNMDDSLFKTGEIETWHKKWVTGLYSYVYYTINYAGTQNRLTYVVYMDDVFNGNWDNLSAQEFSKAINIIYNKSIYYNVYTQTLSVYSNTPRICIDSITHSLRTNNTCSCFYKFTNDYIGTKSSTAKLKEFLFGVFNDLTYDVLNYINILVDFESSNDSQLNHTIIRQSNYQTQIDTYGYAIAEAKQTCPSLLSVNDHFSLEVKAFNANEIFHSSSYSFSLN